MWRLYLPFGARSPPPPGPPSAPQPAFTRRSFSSRILRDADEGRTRIDALDQVHVDLCFCLSSLPPLRRPSMPFLPATRHVHRLSIFSRTTGTACAPSYVRVGLVLWARSPHLSSPSSHCRVFFMSPGARASGFMSLRYLALPSRLH
jgi:hypothetical protein